MIMNRSAQFVEQCLDNILQRFAILYDQSHVCIY